MNRRTFLLALGAAACGTPAANPTPPRRPRRDDAGPGSAEPEQELQVGNVLRSPIALFQDRLVQETRDGQLRFWDTSTMTQVASFEHYTSGFCFLSYGALAAFVQPENSPRCEVHLFDRQRELHVLVGPELETQIDAEVVAGGSPTEIYVSDSKYDIVRLELREREVRATGRITADKRGGRLRQLTSLGDGRVVTRAGDKLLVREPKKPDLAYSIGDAQRFAIHVAAATTKRVWFSHTIVHPSADHGPTASPPHEVSLARFGDAGTLGIDAHVDLAPGEIWHLASGAGALAMTVRTARAWSIVVVEESGKERWRTEVPVAFYPAEYGLQSGYVAIGEQRVVLAASGKLMAWDAATGKVVG